MIEILIQDYFGIFMQIYALFLKHSPPKNNNAYSHKEIFINFILSLFCAGQTKSIKNKFKELNNQFQLFQFW